MLCITSNDQDDDTIEILHNNKEAQNIHIIICAQCKTLESPCNEYTKIN